MIHIILKLDLCATVCDIKFQCNYIQIENEINVLKKNLLASLSQDINDQNLRSAARRT